MTQIINNIIVAAVQAITAVTDLKSHRIPNVIVFPAMFFCLCLNGFPFTTTAWMHAGGALLIMVLLYAKRILGGGDVKLIMLLECAFGFPRAASCLLISQLLLLVFCFFTNREELKTAVKNTAAFIAFGMGIIRFSRKQYPLAVFLLAGGIILNLANMLTGAVPA